AQRAREFGTLRTLGATRRQVLGSVLVEGGTIGVLASVTGLFLGLGLAKALNALFVSFGIDLPKAGTVFATRTIVVSLVVGTLVTLVASLSPGCARRECSRSRRSARASCRRRGSRASGCRSRSRSSPRHS